MYEGVGRSGWVLNLAAGAGSAARNRRVRFESARGSEREAGAALEVACAWGYVGADEAREVDAVYDHVLALVRGLWRRA
jgi:hypothetical protein